MPGYFPYPVQSLGQRTGAGDSGKDTLKLQFDNMMNKEQLTDKQELFCQEYMIDLNATKAYKRAGYSANSDEVAAVEGHKLLINPKISQRLQELMEERSRRTEITQDMVLRELAAIGFAKVTDYLHIIVASDESTSAAGEAEKPKRGRRARQAASAVQQIVQVFETSKVRSGAIPAIASIKQGKEGIEIKLNDKVKALELIARHLGMLNDKIAVEGGGSFLEFLMKSSQVDSPAGDA